jgi:hypothetical protein
VDISAAPFRSDRTTAGQKYFNPQDWTYADGNIWGIDATQTIADFLPAWEKSPVSGTNDIQLSYDETVKSEGKASLKIEYTLTAEGLAGAGPVLTHKSLVGQLDNFNTISVDIFNPDAKQKSIELLLKTTDGKVYKAAFVGYEGSDTPGTSVIVGRTSTFRTLAFNLKSLQDNTGATVANAANLLKNVVSLQFAITDNAAGTIYLDNVSFGFSDDRLSVPTQVNVVEASQLEVSVANNRLSVKSNSNNLIRKIEILNMQGGIIYSKSRINSPEYSFKISSNPGIFIARIQSEKFVSAKKIRMD